MNPRTHSDTRAHSSRLYAPRTHVRASRKSLELSGPVTLEPLFLPSQPDTRATVRQVVTNVRFVHTGRHDRSGAVASRTAGGDRS